MMTKFRPQTCCFSGHRKLPEGNDLVLLRFRTTDIIEGLIDREGYRYFGVGGALGFDTMAAEILFAERQRRMNQIKVILIRPFEGYTSRWTQEQQQAHQAKLPQFDKIVTVSKTPSREAYLARNRHMVDNSSALICYCIRDTGGTAYTVRYAKQRGLVIHNTAR